MSVCNFFQFLIHCLGDAANARLKSSATQVDRGISSGSQDLSGTPNEAIPKLEAYAQCTGEAEYVDDIPPFPGELYAAYVLTTVGKCDINNVNWSNAMVRA